MNNKLVKKINQLVNNYFFYDDKKIKNIQKRRIFKKFINIYREAETYSINKNSKNLPGSFFGKINKKPFLVVVKTKKIFLKTVLKYIGNLNNKNILIKPNFVSVDSYPETTDLCLLFDFIVLLKKSFKNLKISIADGPSIFFNDSLIFERLENKYKKIIIKNNISVINVLGKKYCQYRTKQKLLKYINLPYFLKKYDYLINFSNFKEHNRAGISGPIKNLMGLLPDFERLRIHKFKKNINKAIYELGKIIGSDFIIVDARKILIGSQQRIYGGKEIKGFGILFTNNLFLGNKKSIEFYKKIYKKNYGTLST